MTIKQFRAAKPTVQQALVQFHGRLLLTRKLGAFSLTLYQVDDFYVEVIRGYASNKIKELRCLTLVELDHHLSLIDISPLTSLL